MNENLLRRMKRQLNAKSYVMNDAWLRDCIEFFVRDKRPDEMTDKHIFEFVEGQWQLSDLREISNENGCLPKNLTQQTHVVLTGTYILQVDKMYDIANSKYKQLCEIRKVNNENLEVAGEEERQPKGRRMMQLCLTDGVQDVTAIEYTPVKQITGALLPGYKVMIIGSVNCRRGIILLEDGKYKEIGGEVESLLKPNALENVLARALEEPENPDPYNDNGPSRITNQNIQSVASNSNNDNFFDDDFEEAVDLEAVTAIEQRSQEIKAVQERFESLTPTTCSHRQVAKKETNEIMEETLEDIDFEPFENWPSDLSIKPSRVSPRLEKLEIEKTEEDSITIIEEASTSTRDFHGKPLPPPSCLKDSNFSEFPDDDFDDYDVIIKTKDSQSQQGGNPLKNKIETSVAPTLNLTNRKEVEKNISMKMAQNEKSTASTSKTVQQMSETKKNVPNFLEPLPKIKVCDLSDVLREPIIEKIYRTVRGQVMTHSALTKQGKCWSVTALIADHTSSVEVCFNSEILEEFLGFTVQEFSQKKKLAKSDPQVNNELRLRLRKAQHEIQNLDALLKLELVQGQMPKVIGITQLTEQQKKDFMKRPA